MQGSLSGESLDRQAKLGTEFCQSLQDSKEWNGSGWAVW
jgi:hypothetical protein